MIGTIFGILTWKLISVLFSPNAVRCLWYEHCSMDAITYNYHANYHDAITLTTESAVRMTGYTKASAVARGYM